MKTSTKTARARKTGLADLARGSKRAVAVVNDGRFAEVIALIEAARSRVFQAVNTELVAHYWQLGEHISRKLATAEWGDAVVDELANDLARRYPGVRGYTRRNLFRMRQFYEAHRRHMKVSPLVTQLPWTQHLIILSQARPMVAEYQTFLPTKALLRAKLHEVYAHVAKDAAPDAPPPSPRSSRARKTGTTSRRRAKGA